jgi:hypothetical protein
LVKIREVILYDRSEIPFELMIERICQKYHKLPSEVLDEEMDWIKVLLEVSMTDIERQQKEAMRANMRNTKK